MRSRGDMRFRLQLIILICLILLLPTFLFASNSAMLIAMGPINTNGHIGLNSSALFAGDVVATPQESAATINAEGSMVLVQPDSSVQFQPNAVVMDHGGVVVTTEKGMAVRTGKFTIAPAASGSSSKFEVSDFGGVLQIAARKGDLTISDGATTTVLREGQQTTRQESEQGEERPAHPAASGVHVRRKVVAYIVGGAAAGTTVGILLATRGGGHHVSPATP